ncbi:MAG: LacI family transcriptional regulator [Candidatus Bathyarchaeota archaeon]
MSRALELVFAQVAGGKTKQQVAIDIGYSRPAVSRYMSGTYGESVAAIEAAILKVYDRRVCPHDHEEKQPDQCRRIALRPRPHGFPDAEERWLACQSCPHKPERGGK